MGFFQSIGCFLGLHDPPQFEDQYGWCRICPKCNQFERGDMYGWRETNLDFKPFEWWELGSSYLKAQHPPHKPAAVIDSDGEVHYLVWRWIEHPRVRGRWEDAEL